MQSICIKIDIREKDIWEELKAYTEVDSSQGWYVEQATLDVGDISFHKKGESGHSFVTLERKTAEDFGNSQKDGRYREQRARLYALRGNKTAIGYIVETPPWSNTLTRTWCRGEFTELKLQQAIVRLQLRHTIPVFVSESVKGSIQWIKRIATSLAKDPTCYSCGMATTCAEAAGVYSDTIHVKKASNNTPERVFASMILAIPGLGKTSADAIASETNSSFTKLLEMSEQDIGDIRAGKRKIGTNVASCVFRAIHS